MFSYNPSPLTTFFALVFVDSTMKTQPYRFVFVNKTACCHMKTSNKQPRKISPIHTHSQVTFITMLDTDLLTSLEAMFQTPRMRQDQELLDAMNGRMMLPVGALAALLRGRGQGEVSEDDIVRVGKGTKKFVLEEERTGFYVGPVPQALQKGRCVLAIQPHSITRQEVQGLIPQFSILHSFLIPEALLVAFDDERIAKNAFLELQGKKLKGALVVAKVRLEQFLHIIYSNQATMSHPPNQGRNT